MATADKSVIFALTPLDDITKAVDSVKRPAARTAVGRG